MLETEIQKRVKRGELSAFRGRVMTALLKIPRGRVTTYRALANSLGCGSAQAVGQALKMNPLAPQVPCHRVIKSDLTLGGYHGEITGREIERKLKLLESEGVHFVDGRLSDPQRLFLFSER